MDKDLKKPVRNLGSSTMLPSVASTLPPAWRRSTFEMAHRLRNTAQICRDFQSKRAYNFRRTTLGVQLSMAIGMMKQKYLRRFKHEF